MVSGMDSEVTCPASYALSGSYFSKFLFDPGSTSSSFQVHHFYFRLWFSGLGPILSSKAFVHLGSQCWHGSKAQANMIPFQGFAELSLSCPRKHCSVCVKLCRRRSPHFRLSHPPGARWTHPAGQLLSHATHPCMSPLDCTCEA